MKSLIIAAHPDDEVLGVGGTVARHAKGGDEVEIVILGEGAKSRSQTQGDNRVALLQTAAKQAANALGAGFPNAWDVWNFGSCWGGGAGWGW